MPTNLSFKNSARRPGCLILLLSLVALLAFGGYLFYRLHSIRPSLKRITPGMELTKVRKIIPSGFVRSEIPRDWVPKETVLVTPDAKPAFYLPVKSHPSFFHPAEIAEVYFDQQSRVVGLRYSSDSWRWKPAWGKVTQ